jgi:hypothetical protein
LPSEYARVPLPEKIAHLTHDEQDALEKRVVRKMDFRLRPILIIMFWLNILDRNNIANAKIAGLPKDLHMTNGQYNNCLLIFYVVSTYEWGSAGPDKLSIQLDGQEHPIRENLWRALYCL